MRRFLLILFLLLLPSSAAAIATTDIRCVSTDGTTYESCGGAGSSDGIVKDGAAAGQADVINATPTTEYGLVVRFPSLPAGSNIVGAVTGSGNFTVVQPTGTNLHIVCDAGCGGAASFTDESAFTVATTPINISGYVVDETTPDSAPENSAAAPRMAPNRVPYSILRDAAGNERGANVTAGNALQVDGSAVTQPVSAASLPLPTGAATSANQDGILRDGTGDTTQANVSGGRLHTDGSGVTQPVSGTVTVGTFPDNEPFNLNQIVGTTATVNTGNAGAGTQRVVLASDQPAVTIRGQNSTSPIHCQATALLNMSTATTTQIVALSGSTVIYVCSYAIMSGGTSNVKVVRGTGSNCATGQADVTANWPLVANTGINRTAGGGNVVAKGNAGDAVCVTSSAAVTVAIEVSYAQF